MFVLAVLGITLFGLYGPEHPDPELRRYPCQTLTTRSEDSPYLLPYQAGSAYRVNQANCSGNGHNNFWNHGYDFTMPVGTPVRAARGGQVAWARDGCSDGDRTCTNLITIRHEDGAVSLYSHLTRGGVLVQPGQRVTAGQWIGRSGDTGNTGGLPHLHFSVHPCNELPGLPHPGACPTQRVNFRNTVSNPAGLLPGLSYLALETAQ